MVSRTSRFELFDHTADLGVRVVAPSLPELVWPATEALYAAIGRPVGGGEPLAQTWEFGGAESAVLLRDYLAEVLHWFDARQMVVAALEAVRFGADGLAAGVRLQRLDSAASVLEREVKAVTYHELSIQESDDGYVATFVLDI